VGACLAIGPSGGFSAEELKWLEGNGFLPTRLTASRLRTETAALALASLVLAAGR
jgi:16S rRNA (uracil1498-N3)-methyltransferase